jgi:hypothetical protein
MKRRPFFILALLGCGLASCKKDPTNFYVETKDLTQFHQSYVSQKAGAKPSDSVAVFIDYSKGMHEGMLATMDFVKEILTIVNTPKTVYYKVGAADVPPRVSITQSENVPWNIGNYQETRSVLDKPVDMIVSANQTSVYITDFELVKGMQELQIVQDGKTFKTSIDISAWAVNQFEDWLRKGNAIDVFARRFNKTNSWVPQQQTQYIYILIFTPKALLSEQAALINRLQERGFSESGDNLKHYRFSAEDIALKQTYQDKANIGGATDNAVPNVVHVNFPEFDFYNYQQKDLMKIPEVNPEDQRFLHNLFLANAPVNYPNLQLNLRTYDVTSQYQAFFDYLNPVEEEGDSVKKTFGFQEPSPVEDVFELAFDPKKKEIGLKLHPNFAGVESRKLFKVDVVIDQAKPEFDPQMIETLKWTDARGFEVPSLAKSLTEGLSRIDMRNRVLYTYYIEIE